MTPVPYKYVCISLFSGGGGGGGGVYTILTVHADTGHDQYKAGAVFPASF